MIAQLIHLYSLPIIRQVIIYKLLLLSSNGYFNFIYNLYRKNIIQWMLVNYNNFIIL